MNTLQKSLKSLAVLLLGAAAVSTYALPAYEPFTEFRSLVANNGTNLQCTLKGAVVAEAASGVAGATNLAYYDHYLTNCIDFSSGGLSDPMGDAWSILAFGGTNKAGLAPNGTANVTGATIKGLDVVIIQDTNSHVFPNATVANVLPATFPGFPPAGTAITNLIENAAQPEVFVGATAAVESPYICGNSAVLNLAQDFTRPATGTKTLYISYLLNVAQQGQLGTGNEGRYLGFICQTNTTAGVNSATSYTYWSQMFNTFNTTTAPKMAYHGLLQTSSSFYVGACDSSAGKAFSSTPFVESYNTPIFVVGAYQMTASGTDTNFMWANPATSVLGGPTPPNTSVQAFIMTNPMPDIAGVVFISRVGGGALGGVGTNYIANLLVGTTWSYVTGGPEFTNQPIASTNVTLGQNISLSASATAAAQSVSYVWQKVSGGVTNNLSDGAGMAGGTATVSGSGTTTLTLAGIGAGDVGTYQLLATASGTAFALNSSPTVVALADPQVTANPAGTNVNYVAAANFTATVTTQNAPLKYQWYFGAVPLSNGLQPDGSTVSGASGTTGAGTSFPLTLTLSGVSYQDAGNYTLYVTNNLSLSAVAVPGTLTVVDPIIVMQPATPAVAAGGNATFTVGATGSATLTYQWYENGSPLNNGGTTLFGSAMVSGAQTSTLTLSGVQDADNGNYFCTIGSTASGQSTNSATVGLVVQDPLTVLAAPQSRTERVGDHLAFTVTVAGGAPKIQWNYNSTPITGATNTTLILTNIQTSTNGTYSVTVQNAATPVQTYSATLTVVNNTVLPLYATNILVSRVGDGAQVLSGATGNTLYLDQYTENGTYVSTVQIPDEPTGAPYRTGSSASVANSPALLVQGAGTDAPNAAILTLSGGNQQYLTMAGYCLAYPFSGADVTVAPAANWRGLATLDAFGIYSLMYTNTGLYNGGNHTIRSAVTLDGVSFWTTGQAGANGVKYVNSTVASYATGSGIPVITSSGAGTRVAQIVDGNLVFTDPSSGGLFICAGTPEPVATTTAASSFLLGAGSQPMDFAFSPDLNTLYIADGSGFAGTNAVSGGIERWDTNAVSGGYNFSYTLPVDPTLTLGAMGLAVDFSAAVMWGPGVTGAKLFATTYGASSNSLVAVIDNGCDSIPTVITTVGTNNALRGVRFGPAAVAPSIVTSPLSQTNFPGNSVTFTGSGAGSAPLFYQWYGPGGVLTGATNSSFTTNGITFASAGNYYLVVSNLTQLTATSSPALLAVTAGAPSITPGVLANYTETVGDHVGWGPTINGTTPIAYSWYQIGNPTPVASGTINSLGVGNGGLVLTNIQLANGGTYQLIVSNAYGSATNISGGLLTVTTTRQMLYTTNLVVARIGDSVQALSLATGNTLYLDQYTIGGNYVNSIQIPDEGPGQPYGTGAANSAALPPGSQSLLFEGAGPDTGYEAELTLAPNAQALTFGGYVDAYPYQGSDVSTGGNGGPNWRGVGEVDAYGYYSLLYTNTGLYSGGLHQIHGVADVDGHGTSFYSAGEAGSGQGLKYLTVNNQQAGGGGIVSVAGSFSGTRVVQVVGFSGQTNMVFSDSQAVPAGLYGVSGLPTSLSGASLLIAETNSATDFAVSPDGNTIYIADNGTFAGTGLPQGGIQRWDGTPPASYTYSYTLGTGTGSSAGARALTVDFSAHGTWGAGVNGAKIYAVTAEAAGNRMIEITDSGASSGATTLVTGAVGEVLAGLRFGPAVVAPYIAKDPQSTNAPANSAVKLVSGANGSGPLTYQWYFQAGGVGAFNAINGATNASYTISHVGSGTVGNYYVVATSPSSATATSATATVGVAAPPVFTSETYLEPGVGFEVFFNGTSGRSYSLYSTTDLTQPLVNWTLVTTGTFSGGTDSYTDPAGGSSPQEFYIITSP